MLTNTKSRHSEGWTINKNLCSSAVQLKRKENEGVHRKPLATTSLADQKKLEIVEINGSDAEHQNKNFKLPKEDGNRKSET